VRCLNCGSVNPEANRFCGTCGAALTPAPAAAAAPPVPAQAASQREPTAVREAPVFRQTHARHSEPLYSSVAGDRASLPSSRSASPAPLTPLISGPSFLGLNQPGPSTPSSRRSSLSIDPSQRSDLKSFDYLLNEEDEERGGGAWKYVALVGLLLIALGFGYVRWRSQVQGWVKANKPAAAGQAVDDSNAASPAQSSPAASTDVANNQPAAPPVSPPAAASQPAADGGQGTPPSSANGSAPNSTPDKPNSSTSADATPAPPGKTATNNDSEDADSAPAAKADAPEAAPAPKKSAPARPAKPTPTIAKPDMSNLVTEATQYIYGKGVTQDCDRGLRLLKPAANQSDPRAMIQMGALYSAGLCTPRDLPTAYRWFALALRKEPDNMSVQGDLQKLWGEMTPPERQLAIRLTH
jgi:hypothetical protein